MPFTANIGKFVKAVQYPWQTYWLHGRGWYHNIQRISKLHSMDAGLSEYVM